MASYNQPNDTESGLSRTPSGKKLRPLGKQLAELAKSYPDQARELIDNRMRVEQTRLINAGVQTERDVSLEPVHRKPYSMESMQLDDLPLPRMNYGFPSNSLSEAPAPFLGPCEFGKTPNFGFESNNMYPSDNYHHGFGLSKGMNLSESFYGGNVLSDHRRSMSNSSMYSILNPMSQGLPGPCPTPSFSAGPSLSLSLSRPPSLSHSRRGSIASFSSRGMPDIDEGEISFERTAISPKDAEDQSANFDRTPYATVRGSAGSSGIHKGIAWVISPTIESCLKRPEGIESLANVRRDEEGVLMFVGPDGDEPISEMVKDKLSMSYRNVYLFVPEGVSGFPQGVRQAEGRSVEQKREDQAEFWKAWHYIEEMARREAAKDGDLVIMRANPMRVDYPRPGRPSDEEHHAPRLAPSYEPEPVPKPNSSNAKPRPPSIIDPKAASRGAANAKRPPYNGKDSKSKNKPAAAATGAPKSKASPKKKGGKAKPKKSIKKDFPEPSRMVAT